MRHALYTCAAFSALVILLAGVETYRSARDYQRFWKRREEARQRGPWGL